MTNKERWDTFIADFSAYIEEYHHCPNKHCTLYNAPNYYRRKIKEGKLTPDKAKMLEDVLTMRDSSEHIGG